ncbi:MAG TPA: gfo/Idh/MocA family oxidoreductase, partial [Methylomirabilota bacterium]
LDAPALPPDEKDGVTYFLSRVRDGRPIEGLCAPEVGRDVQEILAAALRASATGSTVTLPAAV